MFKYVLEEGRKVTIKSKTYELVVKVESGALHQQATALHHTFLHDLLFRGPVVCTDSELRLKIRGTAAMERGTLALFDHRHLIR